MKLLGFVEYLATPSRLEEYYREQGIGEEAIKADNLCIYMVGLLDLNADVKLFDLEETGGLIEFQKDGINYVYVLEVDLAVDLLASDLGLKGKGVTNQDRADSLLHYAIYDA